MRSTTYVTTTDSAPSSCAHLDRLDRDQVAELLLQRALDEVLGRGDELGPARLEDEREQAAAEVGPHHALARRGEEHLLDQVAQVVVGARARGPAAAVDVVGEVDLGHVASTRGWAERGSIGVPVATQVEAPAIVASGHAAREHAHRAA